MYHATRAATEVDTATTKKRASELEIARKRETEQRAMSPVAAIVISEEPACH
jgi:hypothetical protein